MSLRDWLCRVIGLRVVRGSQKDREDGRKRRARTIIGGCEHCGAAWDDAHEQGYCGAVDATRRLLENYRPRTATAGFECPNGHGDGIWEWGPKSESFRCAECGVLVDPYSGALLEDPKAPIERRTHE